MLESRFEHEINRMMLSVGKLAKMKLERNADKGLWTGATLDDLKSKLKEEFDELNESINKGARFVEIVDEAVDVVCVAMMIADIMPINTYDYQKFLQSKFGW